MNRHQRREQAAKDRGTRMRHAAIEDALAFMRAANDPTISGATLILPDRQVLHLSAEMAQAAMPQKEGQH